MKKLIKLTCIAAIAVLLAVACATKAPTALETQLFDVATNTVTLTNVTPVVESITNDAGTVTTKTNWQSEAVEVEAYDFKPGEKAQAVIETGGAIGGLFGVGGLVSTALSGLLGLWAAFRSKKTSQTAAVLAQVIETGRSILKTTPQGSQLDSAWRDWMLKHQKETGVVQEVLKLLPKVVDNATAQQTAKQLLALMDYEKKPEPTY